jgi:hypothetical protein
MNKTFDNFQQDFIKWVIEEIEPDKGDGYAVCPYARAARLGNQLQFIDCSGYNNDGILDAILDFDPINKLVGVCWFGDDADMSTVNLEAIKQECPDLMYFISTPSSGHFAKNVSNTVLIQIRPLLMKRRASLHKTKFYDSWPEEYYKLIMTDQ